MNENNIKELIVWINVNFVNFSHYHFKEYHNIIAVFLIYISFISFKGND